MMDALAPHLNHTIYIAEYIDGDEFYMFCRKCGRNARTRPEGLTKEVCPGAFMSASARRAFENLFSGREPKATRGSRVMLREPILG